MVIVLCGKERMFGRGCVALVRQQNYPYTYQGWQRNPPHHLAFSTPVKDISLDQIYNFYYVFFYVFISYVFFFLDFLDGGADGGVLAEVYQARCCTVNFAKAQ